MAFPVIEAGDTQFGTVTSNSSSWSLVYPTNLASGDLILALVACDGNGAVGATWPTDWFGTHNANGASAISWSCTFKISDGSETGTFTFGPSASEQGAWRIYRITGWYGTGIPATLATGAGTFNFDGVSYVETTSTTGDPDPPSLNPGNWDVEDTKWIAACMVDTSRTISAYPLVNTNTADVSGGAGGATLGLCWADSAVSSLDPGTFTISASDDWAALTIAIRPSAGNTSEKVGLGVIGP